MTDKSALEESYAKSCEKLIKDLEKLKPI